MKSKIYEHVGVLIVAILCFNASPSFAQLHIQWRDGIDTSIQERPSVAQVIDQIDKLQPRTGSRHFVVQFSKPFAQSQRSNLLRDGITLLNYLGDNAYFAVITSNGISKEKLLQVGTLTGASEIQNTWKLHPMFSMGEKPTWAIVGDEAVDDPTIGVYVLFHSDISLHPMGRDTVLQYGGVIRSTLKSINGFVVEIRSSQINALVLEDSVQYIEPALPKMSALNDNNRILSEADVVQMAPYNLDGSGVTVVVYDVGTAKRSTDNAVHPDLTTHLIVADSSSANAHSSHVACTLGGDGTTSLDGKLRGMAPATSLLSYGFEDSGINIPLYTDPGDLESDYNNAINVHGAVIANNSIGTNTCANSPTFPCNLTGDYGSTSALIDNIVRGSLGTPFRIVWANGNERSCTKCPGEHQNGYHSTAPPSCSKNAISVGAVNSNDDSMTSFSSWGPCDDGRLKPDISAPGCQSDGDFGVTSCNTAFGTFGYSRRCGTSMAAPTVTGLASLLIEDFRIQYPSSPDPLNSTIKTLLAHNAVDIGNVGPDYQSGYGSVRIQSTIDFMRTGSFVEDQVDSQGTVTTFFDVNPGDPQLKVTLAWDDIAGTPNVNPALVNDLDLRVFDPSNTQYFPWTLDPANPSLPAIQTLADHTNNIEQIVVNAPVVGQWRVEVFGFSVISDAIIPSGFQPYSIAISPVPILCSSTGTISLNQADYSCEDTAIIRVVDCDLNTSDVVVDTVTISIASTTETVGESVLLTETAADSAVFSGSIALSSTDSSGVLQVTNLDTVTATYTDTDDGLGGFDIIKTDTSTTSCSLPTISIAVQLQGIDTAVIRDVTFIVTDCSGPQSETTTLPVSFDAAGNGTVDLTTSLINASWISANEGHSLRRLIQLGSPLPANVSFTSADLLLAGNFSGDDLVDVEDFSILASNWNLVGSLADINGDNLQDTIDFTAIAVNILTIGDAVDGCNP